MSTRIRKSSSTMRKAPRQARSRATVEAVVAAGTRILANDGWAGFNTNKIAEIAGVSIGSLYQYFPDKLSLVDAIRQRHLDDCLAVMRRLQPQGRTVAAFVEDLVDSLIEVHSIQPGIHRVLLDEAPSHDRFRDPASDFEIEYLSHFRRAVAAFRPEGIGDIETMTQIVSDALDGVIHNAARRGTLASPDVRQELVRLLSLYLKPQ